jgi:ubiquinone/menaquinone biosynthesis C-methylase UbiE
MPKVEPFEIYVKRYEEWFERNENVYKSELRAVKTLLPERGTGVEIGVGTARFALPLGIKLGIEPSKAMGKVACKRGVEVIGAVAENLPLADSQFDFVLMVTTICFLDDIAASFKEAYRILKPKGTLVIGFVDRDSLLGKKYQKHKDENVFYREATFYSVGDVISHLKKAGFKDFALVQTIFEDLTEIDNLQPVKEGYGEGSFVVVRGWK